jgi:hypothetical protein
VLLLCSACVIFISILFIFWDRRVFVGLMGDDGRGKTGRKMKENLSSVLRCK